MLTLISNRWAIRLGWFCFYMEMVCLLGASRQTSYLCHPYCSCDEGKMTCQWSSNLTINHTNGTETVFVYEMKNVTCKPLTSNHPIDIHFVKSDIDFIPTCMFENTTVVNLMFLESKIKVIRVSILIFNNNNKKNIDKKIMHGYGRRSENNASYLFSHKLQKTQKAQ